jgi:hypothetical protein
MENLLCRGASLNYAARGASEHDARMGASCVGYFINEISALRFLSSIHDPVLREKFAHEAGKYTKLGILSLLQRANKLATLIQTRQISFDQALAWEKPEVQGAMAFCRASPYLPRGIYILIAAFSFNNEQEAIDLFNKMPFEIKQAELAIELRRCHLLSSPYSLFRDKRPARLELICREAKSEIDLHRSFADEMSLLTKKDSYSDLLQNYVPDVSLSTAVANPHRSPTLRRACFFAAGAAVGALGGVPILGAALSFTIVGEAASRLAQSCTRMT